MTTKKSTKDFAFEDLTKISRAKLGNSVPLELYRAIRLIRMYQGLPLKGEGLPEIEGSMVCDLEGAIMEGALSKIWNKRVSVKETKCNVNGDEHCEYEVRF
ncbi:V4R domain protein [compost metagenome]